MLTLAPAVAAYAKLSFIQLLADRTPIAELPAWIFTYGKLGLVEICGRAATDAAAAAQACAALPEPAQALRLQDITLSPDMIVLALPDMAELDHVVLGLLAAVALAVAIATANGPLSAIVRALGRDDPPSGADGEPAEFAPCLVWPSPRWRWQRRPVGALVRPAEHPRCGDLRLRHRRRRPVPGAVCRPVVAARQRLRRRGGDARRAGRSPRLPRRHALFRGAVLSNGRAALSNAGARASTSFAELKDAWLAAAPGAAKDAAWAALQAQARDNANWWGVNGLAVALLALPVGFVALVVVSLHHAGAAPGGNRAVSPRMLGSPP